MVETFIKCLSDPTARVFFSSLVKLLGELSVKDKLTLQESELVHLLFENYVPKPLGERSRLEFVLDKLAEK